MTSYYSIELPIIHGTFCSEIKNRFMARVVVNGIEEECYIPSSARLENFLRLVGRQVLLVPTQANGARTRYSVLAVKVDRHNVLVNASLANKAMLHYLQTSVPSAEKLLVQFFSEKYVNGYKADLLMDRPQRAKIFEIKSVLAINSDGIFPTVFSERANMQLKKLQNLIADYDVEYCFVAICPEIRRIHINHEQQEYHALFKQCIEKGMAFKGYSCALIGRRVVITGELPVILD